VPSSGSFPRPQPPSLSGFRASSGGFSPSPGSYQEQLLFIANENAKQSPAAASSQFGTPFGGSSQFAVSFFACTIKNSNSIISPLHFPIRRGCVQAAMLWAISGFYSLFFLQLFL